MRTLVLVMVSCGLTYLLASREPAVANDSAAKELCKRWHERLAPQRNSAWESYGNFLRFRLMPEAFREQAGVAATEYLHDLVCDGPPPKLDKLKP